MNHEIWPAEDLETVPGCPVCGATERTLLYASLTDRVFGVAPGTWTLYRCSQCESAWLDPRPTPASIGKAYADYFTHIPDGDVSVVPRSRIVRWMHACLNGYSNARYGLKRTPTAAIGRWIIPMIPWFRAKADAQCRHLHRPSAGGRRLLDVGFGNGGFLKLAGEMGWDADGIDFDAEAVEVARAAGLHVRWATVDELLSLDEHYDVITISHVIEHVYEPVALLGSLYRLLKPGGCLWLETPNVESAGARRFGSGWRDLDPPRHLVLFNPRSLKVCLENAGFHKISQRWHGMVSLSVYAASAAILEGKLAKDVSPRLVPSWAALISELQEAFDPVRREFLTIIAYKPW